MLYYSSSQGTDDGRFDNAQLETSCNVTQPRATNDTQNKHNKHITSSIYNYDCYSM